MSNYQGIFKNKYPDLRGKDWLNQVDKDDKAVMQNILKSSNQCGQLGGKARAGMAERDARGRFTCHYKPDPIYPNYQHMRRLGNWNIAAKINNPYSLIAYDKWWIEYVIIYGADCFESAGLAGYDHPEKVPARVKEWIRCYGHKLVNHRQPHSMNSSETGY